MYPFDLIGAHERRSGERSDILGDAKDNNERDEMIGTFSHHLKKSVEDRWSDKEGRTKAE